MGIRTFQKRGYEADDLMATLTRHARIQGYPVHLITNDKDLHQLIIDDFPHVRQFSLNGNDMYDENAVLQKFGIKPHQMIDYQAMVGDSVDNVRGITGVGAKTASALLQHFGSLEDMFENLDDVMNVQIRGAKSLSKKLDEGKEVALMARELVTLIDNVDVVDMYPDSILTNDLFGVENLRWKGPPMEGRDFFIEMDFDKMYQDFRHLVR